MITVKLLSGGERQAQITSSGPPRTLLTYWARTCDDGPARWLLIRERTDPISGKVGYEEREQP